MKKQGQAASFYHIPLSHNGKTKLRCCHKNNHIDQWNITESSGTNYVYGILLYKIKVVSQIHGETMNYLVKWFGKSESLLNLIYQSKLQKE